MEELNEDLKFKISLKTLMGIVAGVAAIVGAWYAFDSSIDARIEEKINSVKPGKGFYQVDPADPAAKETWPASRPESDMKLILYGEHLESLTKRVENLERK